MKKFRNSFMAIVLAGAAMIAGISGMGLQAKAQNAHIPRTGAVLMEETVEIQAGEPVEHEELLEEYIDSVLYDDTERVVSGYVLGAEKISIKEQKEFYEKLAAKIKNIAAGRQTSTVAALDMNITWTAADLGVSQINDSNCKELVKQKIRECIGLSDVISYLLKDYPFELYWFDKTAGTSLYYSFDYDSKAVYVGEFTVYFPVVPAYQGYSADPDEKIYTFDTSLMATVTKAKNKAMSIVEEAKSLSRYEKLVAYRDAVCELTEYYTEAAEDPNMAYGHPWQMIWVFDEDPYTNVVCEGYSKAYQYLCDLSGLTCYTVDGVMANEYGGGPHMWNVVTFGEKNYLVDITNCDEGASGYPDILFMAGTNVGNVANGYTFPECYDLCYTYSDDQEMLMGREILTLASESFDPSVISNIEVAFENEEESVLFTDMFPKITEPAVTSNGAAVEDVDITYFHRYKGSSVDFVEGLPVDVGVFEVKAVAEGDIYLKAESSNVLTLTIEPSVVGVFDDICGYDWFFEYVQYAYDNNLMRGISGTAEFQPNADITKAQVAQVLYNMEEQPEVLETNVFMDLQDVYDVEWYADAVAWAYNEGIITGDLYTKKFSPNTSVTREQLALMLFRFADYKGIDVSKRGDLAGLKNDWKVNTYAEEAVKWAVGEGLISGIEIRDHAGNVTARDLAPQGTASRGQMATILTRLCENFDFK